MPSPTTTLAESPEPAPGADAGILRRIAAELQHLPRCLFRDSGGLTVWLAQRGRELDAIAEQMEHPTRE